MHKYLFGSHFFVVVDLEMLMIYNPHASLAKSSAAVIQRWNISLSIYSYDIQYRKAESIPQADCVSICCL